jgi:GDP-fucose transporter C1
MITFNNLCLKWVEVSFYNVARSLTIVFNVILSFLILSSPSSPQTLGALGVVVLGFLLGSSGEANFSLRGTTAGIMSSVFVSLNSIFTKKLLTHVQDNHWRLTFYNNVNALILFIPLILLFEGGRVMDGLPGKGMIFWSAMSLAGVMGFLIGIVTVLQIKATSPLTHNISGTAKAAVQSAMAFWIWGNAATGKGVAGIAMVLGGEIGRGAKDGMSEGRGERRTGGAKRRQSGWSEATAVYRLSLLKQRTFSSSLRSSLSLRSSRILLQHYN